MEQLLTTGYVVDSSGCHRYDYWNEQAVFDGRSDTGWCTPRRSTRRVEFLEISLGRACMLSRIRLQARSISGHAGFPHSLCILQRDEDAWSVLWCTSDADALAGEWFDARLAPSPVSELRLELADPAWRADGTYFLQLMQIELFEEIIQ